LNRWEIVEDTVNFSFGFKIKIHNSNSTSLFLVSFCRQKTKGNWKLSKIQFEVKLTEDYIDWLSASCLNHDFYVFYNKPFKEKEN